MNILFATDENYAKYLIVAIYGIIKHNRHKQTIHFYIAHHHLSEATQQEMIHTVHHFSEIPHQITFIPISAELFNRFPKTIDYIPSITYARLAIADIYHWRDVDRLIYLDIDILINGDLYELWSSDLQDNTIGACFDQHIEYYKLSYKTKIGIKAHNPYFNAGVLLIDMKKWLAKDILSEAINWINRYQNIMLYQDQDILNGLFQEDVCILNNRFNCMTITLAGIIDQKAQKDLLPCEEIKNPIIIYHYTGPDKPWNCSSCMQSYQYYKLANEVGITLTTSSRHLKWTKRLQLAIKNKLKCLKIYFKM